MPLSDSQNSQQRINIVIKAAQMERLSTGFDIQPVGSMPFPKCRPQFMCNLANSVNQVVYKTQHSSTLIIAEDVFCLADCTERLTNYITFNQNAHQLFVQMVGKYFETSPNERRTELPLMILTGTKTILMRRIKKLKKLQKDESSSRSSTLQEISFSKNVKPNSKDDYLQSRISQKSFTSFTDAKSSTVSKGSKYCIFNPVYSNGQNDLNANLRAIAQSLRQSSSRIKMLSVIDPEQKQMTVGIRSAREGDLNHLILRYGFGESSGESRQNTTEVRQLSEDQQTGMSRRIVLENLPVEVRSRVSKELQKYSWVGGMGLSSSMQSRGKKRVREKAEEMLREMGVGMEK